MTKKERKELEQKKNDLKLLFELHAELQLIKDDYGFEQHLNDILDEIASIEKELKKYPPSFDEN